MPSKFSSSSRIVCLGLAVLALFGARVGAAAEPVGTAPVKNAKVLILGGETVDPETGVRANKVLNPSGEAKVAFTTWGLTLSYIEANGKPATLALHADFPQPPAPTADANANLHNRLMAEMIASGGSIQAADILRTLPEQMAAEGKQVALSFSTKNRSGFVISDYGFSDVTVQVLGLPRLSLHQMVMNVIGSRVHQQMVEMATGTAIETVAKEAAAPAKQTITAESFNRGLCEAMFRPSN